MKARVFMKELDLILQYYEDLIDVDNYYKAIERQKKCYNFEQLDRLCIEVPYRCTKFKGYSMQETHDDMGKMMFNELISCNSYIEIDNNGLPMIRANYGVGTLPSYFGAKSKIVNNSMPWVEHLDKDEIMRIINEGVPKEALGFSQKVIDTYEFYREKLSKYPKCNEVIKLFHPDFQGPFDVAHLLYGTDIYYDMYDDPDTVHALLSVITDTYIARMKKIKPLLNDEIDGYNMHWRNLFPGSLVLRNDTAVNVSADMYNEFIRPYDERIMEAFGPSSMHFCGRADQWIFEIAKSENIAAYNFGYMDKLVFGKEYLDFLSPEFTSKKKPIVCYVVRDKDISLLDCPEYHTGISYHHPVRTKEEAEEFIARYTL